MGHSTKAIRKGMAAEHLAKAHFSKQGYVIFEADSHETNFDFIASKDKEFIRVQVKADCITNISGISYVRFRNKHGQNRSYQTDDYDILAGVWVEQNKIYLFHSEDVNKEGQGETLTVERLDEKQMTKRKTATPFYVGPI